MLELVEMSSDKVGLTGVFVGQTEPEFLGLSGLIRQGGPFFIGFDTRFKPTMVRIFYDHARALFPSTVSNWQAIGLVQVGQITYQGIPIGPATYGMTLDYLSPYVYNNTNKPQFAQYWVDMMDVGKVKAKSIPLPLFALNGYLRNPGYSSDAFFTHPMPNGSLTKVPAGSQAGTSYCASLFDAIDFDLDTPTPDVITKMVRKLVDGEVEPLTKAYSKEEVLTNGPLKLAFDLLELDETTPIEDIQVAGPHILIALTDIEDEGPLYTAFFDQTKETETHSTLTIYQVNREKFDELRFAALTDTFSKIKTDLSSRGLQSTEGIPVDRPSSGGRGGRGLNPFPFFFNGDVDPEIAFTYRTLAVGINDNDIQHCFGGLEWTVSRVFDRGELEFGPLRIELPKMVALINNFNKAKRGQIKADTSFITPLLTTFKQALELSETPPTNPLYFENTSGVATLATSGYGDWSQNWFSRV